MKKYIAIAFTLMISLFVFQTKNINAKASSKTKKIKKEITCTKNQLQAMNSYTDYDRKKQKYFKQNDIFKMPSTWSHQGTFNHLVVKRPKGKSSYQLTVRGRKGKKYSKTTSIKLVSHNKQYLKSSAKDLVTQLWAYYGDYKHVSFSLFNKKKKICTLEVTFDVHDEI